MLKKDEEEMQVTDEQREKTIRCLLKVLDYQLSSVKEQASDIEKHYKRVDEQLKDFDKQIKNDENKAIFDDVKRRIEKTKQRNDQYEAVFGDDELYNVAEIITENKILINKFDALMGQQYQAAKAASE